MRNCQRKTASQVARVMAMYSLSVEERLIEGCFLAAQDIRQPLRRKMYPEIEQQEFGLLAQSAST